MSHAGDRGLPDSGPQAAGQSLHGVETDIPERLSCNVVLPEFEGPLDLLLYLCKSHELSIVDIPIAFVTEKYLEYLDLMQDLSVEIAAEYLVMAATLCDLKVRELLPEPTAEDPQAEEESGVNPREELIRRLLEYQKYKDAAEKLGARPVEGRNVFGRGMPAWEGTRPEGGLAEHSPWKLIESFAHLIARAGEAAKVHNVVLDRMSVADRINQLVDRLDAGEGSFRFDSVVDLTLPEAELRHQLVVTLLAILEMARLRMIRVLRDETSGTFFIARSARATARPSVTAREESHGEEREDRNKRADAADGAIQGRQGGKVDVDVGQSNDVAAKSGTGDSGTGRARGTVDTSAAVGEVAQEEERADG